MREPAVRHVMQALGAEHDMVRFVGGCVRDWLIGLPVRDIDLAVRYPPAETIRRLKRAGMKAIPIGLAHGVVLGVHKKRNFEIASLRADVSTDGRHAFVTYGKDWYQDAQRRDFTINALYADARGRLYDPFGGQSDLRRGMVRFVGDADTRVREDRLRVLRYYRFFVRYGRGKPHPGAARACRNAAGELQILAVERIWDELKSLLCLTHCLRGLALMAEHGVLKALLPEAGDLPCLERLLRLETPLFQCNPIGRLVAVLTPQADAALLARRLNMSRQETDTLIWLHEKANDWPLGPKSDDWQPLIYAHGAARVADWLLVSAARSGRPSLPASMMNTMRDWPVPSFPLKGRDILALGISKGPHIGAVLAQVETWWQEGGFKADRATCLEKALAIITARPASKAAKR